LQNGAVMKESDSVRKKITLTHILSLLAAVYLFCPITHAAGFHYQQLGIAVTPRSFPNHTPEDIDNAFTLAKKLGQSTVLIYQWGKLDLNGARFMQDKTVKMGMHSIIGLSPTTLDQGRKELDIPDELRAKVNGWISFANPAIRNEYKQTAIALAMFKPDYQCLATEINLLGLQRQDEYLQFASLYKEAYDEVKRVSPKTRVFVSFQYEWIRRLDAEDPRNLAEHSKLIDIFRPKLDVVGLTTYPAEYHKSPTELPPDYYSRIYRHIPRSNRVLFMETGWPTQGAGSTLEQVLFIARLPGLLKEVDVEVLAWALLHDVNLGEFSANLNSVGLITQEGQFKPGIKAFDDLAAEL
jgi:hypothetical protein